MATLIPYFSQLGELFCSMLKTFFHMGITYIIVIVLVLSFLFVFYLLCHIIDKIAHYSKLLYYEITKK